MNILIVKQSALGDVTHTLPVLTALRRHYPDASISWLVEETAKDIVTGHTALDRVLVWRRRQFTSLLWAGSWLSAFRLLYRFIRELRDTPYDLVIDFQALIKSGIWVGISRGKRKAGFGKGLAHSECSYLFLNERIPAVSMEIHALKRGLLLLEALGIPCPDVRYDFPISQESWAQVNAFLDEHNIGREDPLIAIHPMTRWPTKLWYSHRFAEAADQLIQRGLKAVFTGSAEDRPSIDEITQNMQAKALRFDGKGDLKALAALFQRAQIVVSTDTGPMHIAAAVGTPVVALFGPTAPNRTGPYGSQHTVLRSDVPCNPCFHKTCLTTQVKKMACMNEISTQDLVQAVLEKLESKPRKEKP